MSLKIMLVDEDAATLRSMRSLVVPLGHEILTFGDSREAAERAEKQRFDVVFVEMHMRQLDGLELTRRLQNSGPNRETAVVMLGTTSEIEDLRKSFNAGATFYLRKPVEPARLLPMLRAMERPGWKDRRHAARLPLFAPVNCKWGDREFPLRSLNISETGMLLQPSVDVEEGQEVSLEFKIAEIRASLNVRGKIIRKEGTERVGIEFGPIAPEHLNAIQLYIMGRLKEPAPPRPPLRTRLPRLLRPND